MQNELDKIMANPLVSVIIPTYNRTDVVGNAIDSVLQQTYKKIEIIVVDDGSTDNTQDKLAQYRNVIKVVRQVNAGPAAARNRGVEVSRGEILAFLDSDDLWLPTKIERQVDAMQKTDKSVPCCLCNAIIHAPNGEERTSFDLACLKASYKEGIWKNVAQVLSTRCVFFTQALAVRREAFLRVGGFDDSLPVMEDHDLALRLSLAGPWVYIKEPLVIYHADRPDGLAYQARKEKIQFQKAMVRLYSKSLSNSANTCHKTRRQLEHKLKIARRRLRLVHECGGRAIYASVLRNLLRFERLKMAVYHRLPWFRKMDDSPLDEP